MKIQEFVELNTFSTFMVQATARYFVSIDSEVSFQELLDHEVWRDNEHYFLGEGSNTLFSGNYEGLIIKNDIQGLEVVSEDTETITIRVGAGENWHNLVLWSLDQKLWGFENLALIPGTVGAAPVQNIGAYGVEVQETVSQVDAVDTTTGEIVTLFNEDCNFSYRNSVFKEHPGKYFIFYVYFVLQKQGAPVLSYGRVAEVLEEKNIENPSPQEVAAAIISIRDSKLPRVGDVGTAGSFFKNPLVSTEKSQELQVLFPDIVMYPSEEGSVKISAAWLIEYCGYKGVRHGQTGTYEKHALVLINHGGALGSEVWDFAQMIISDVQKKFGITLEPEVRVIS